MSRFGVKILRRQRSFNHRYLSGMGMSNTRPLYPSDVVFQQVKSRKKHPATRRYGRVSTVCCVDFICIFSEKGSTTLDIFTWPTYLYEKSSYERVQETVSWVRRWDQGEDCSKPTRQSEIRITQTTHQPIDGEVLADGSSPTEFRWNNVTCILLSRGRCHWK